MRLEPLLIEYLTCLSFVQPTGRSALGYDGRLEAEVKRIILGCRTQEVRGAKRDHLAGAGPTSLPGDRGRTY